MYVSEAVTYDIDEINGVYFDIDAKSYGKITSLQVFEDKGHYENNAVPAWVEAVYGPSVTASPPRSP